MSMVVFWLMFRAAPPLFLEISMIDVNSELILEERHRYIVSYRSVSLLLEEKAKEKWNTLSEWSRQNLFSFFVYKEGLSEIHDSRHCGDYLFWKNWFTNFIMDYDEKKPTFGECFTPKDVV